MRCKTRPMHTHLAVCPEHEAGVLLFCYVRGAVWKPNLELGPSGPPDPGCRCVEKETSKDFRALDDVEEVVWE